MLPLSLSGEPLLGPDLSAFSGQHDHVRRKLALNWIQVPTAIRLVLRRHARKHRRRVIVVCGTYTHAP